MRYRKSIINFLSVYCVCFLSILNLLGQESIWEIEMKKIESNYSVDSQFIQINYSERFKGSIKTTLFDSCFMAVYKKNKHIIFDNYVIIDGSNYYLKVVHKDSTFYLFGYSEDKPFDQSQEQEAWLFNKESCTKYKVEFDTLYKQQETGTILFKGSNDSFYKQLIFQYDIKNYQLDSYQIFFNTPEANGRELIQLDFKTIPKKKIESLQFFNSSSYYTINKSGEVLINDSYQSYQLIKNF